MPLVGIDGERWNADLTNHQNKLFLKSSIDGFVNFDESRKLKANIWILTTLPYSYYYGIEVKLHE